MSVNKFLPHVFVVPEDRADEELANGFVQHDQVDGRQVQVLRPADGWSGVLDKFTTQYIPYLRNHSKGYVILLIDFDSKYDDRRDQFKKAVPVELENRVFVVGCKETPELLRQALGESLEDIGRSLADDCYKGTVDVWGHDHLKHNEPDRMQLVKMVKSILFPK